MKFLPGISIALSLSAGSAVAGEGAFGWLYSLDLQPQGKVEIEQRVDRTHRQAAGRYDWTQFRTAVEYGLTNELQMGVYLNAFSLDANANYLSSEMCDTVPCTAGFGVPGTAANGPYRRSGVDGGSLEFIWRLSNPVTSPVGVGLYLEPSWGKLEDTVEARLLLQSNFLDDRLILLTNAMVEWEREKYDRAGGIIRNTMADLLYGASYRFAPRWSAGLEGRLHTDHDGYRFQRHTQTGHFIGPNVHYASERWWATAAWRHQVSGSCYSVGTADCSMGRVWDGHGRDQFMLKVGYLLN
ncbi:DUF6662 family protein [Xylophilus sp. GOD-11R]|uniref:DUF6662 family protein n=1 Tax=Xylophilus sp. GOD-11R TaxID=3089814 RepID=UPI00298CD682|nr:DUF6662 family protein [Xylophilus sp. GOD-11R]WPB54950.1 DUF6662 family protein [Xylophilus sp. GOD-11R]